MAEGESNTLTRILDYFTRGRRWGTVTIHYESGKIKLVQTSESFKPSSYTQLAAAVSKDPTVAAALRSGEAQEIVMARIRGGRLTVLAVETHHKVTEVFPNGNHAEQPRSLAGSEASPHP